MLPKMGTDTFLAHQKELTGRDLGEAKRAVCPRFSAHGFLPRAARRVL